jgi:uncharacterized membrane protein
MEVRMQRGPRGRSLLVLVALIAVLGALGAPSATAAPSFSVVSTSTSPDPVTPGATATITTSVRNSGSLASGVIVDMEVFNSSGGKVFQQYIPGNNFGTGETKTFQWFWSTPSNQAAGTYTVKIAVFSDHWVTILLWNNSADTFTVAPATPGVAFAIGHISVSPGTIQRGGTVSVSAPVTNTGTSAASGINVLLHLTNPLGNDFPGNQVIIENQSFAAGQTRTLTFQWRASDTAAQGRYSIGIGAFSGNWNTLYAWENSGSAFTVGTVNNPTFAVGTTSVSPNPVARGAVATVTTHVRNTSTRAAANVIVLCEINTADGNENITSQYVTGLSFSPGQNRALGFAFTIPGNLAPGTYSIDIGVFNGDWSTMYRWGFIVTTFTVR